MADGQYTRLIDEKINLFGLHQYDGLSQFFSPGTYALPQVSFYRSHCSIVNREVFDGLPLVDVAHAIDTTRALLYLWCFCCSAITSTADNEHRSWPAALIARISPCRAVL